MIFRSLSLQSFRSYTKAEFTFDPHLTVIVGPNAAGKTNLVEAIRLLATGKSFRTDKEKQLIQFGKPVARIKGMIASLRATPIKSGEKGNLSIEEIASSQAPRNDEDDTLEVVINESAKFVLQKKYLVNGVSKRRVDFAGRIAVVLFTPLDLDIVSGQPGNRRRFLDEVLEQVDLEYRTALSIYTKALRQRNALLEQVQKSGIRDERRFAYWNDLLIKNGGIITAKREAVISFINNQEKHIFPFILEYDHSVISEERLLQYKQAEVGAGVTLVGPQRDDVMVKSRHTVSEEMEEVKYFCSRGQQRLVTLELKLAQIAFIKERKEEDPVLVLDDIFSELDTMHIQDVLQMTNDYQTIITTTHKEFIESVGFKEVEMIELGG